MSSLSVRKNVSLARYTTLQAGGEADQFIEVSSSDGLESAALHAFRQNLPLFVLGWGSNILVADDGIEGLVIKNDAKRIVVARTGEVLADAGCMVQDLFLKTAQAGLKGFEFAVGIPGTLGGALVSNAGAYRSCISDCLTEMEVVTGGVRQWVPRDWMQFSYRDSRLRRFGRSNDVLLRARFKLPQGASQAIFAKAKDIQIQRILKQPPSASAGSFFKNVISSPIAASLADLPQPLREQGIIPAGYLLEAAGMKGLRHGKAAFGIRHANFILNVGGASSAELRELAAIGKRKVWEMFGVVLEEEVLYVGRWPLQGDS